MILTMASRTAPKHMATVVVGLNRYEAIHLHKIYLTILFMLCPLNWWGQQDLLFAILPL